LLIAASQPAAASELIELTAEMKFPPGAPPPPGYVGSHIGSLVSAPFRALIAIFLQKIFVRDFFRIIFGFSREGWLGGIFQKFALSGDMPIFCGYFFQQIFSEKIS
jgi:hypothetical protein